MIDLETYDTPIYSMPSGHTGTQASQADHPNTELMPVADSGLIRSPLVADSHLIRSPPVFQSLVFANLQNQNTDDPGSTFTCIVPLPSNPFASQIVVALNTNNSRIASTMGKWTLSRILVAYSKRLIPVDEKGYNGAFSGYQEVGLYNDVVARFEENGIGGRDDATVPQVVEDKDVRDFRQLYDMSPGTHVFSVYIFHTVRSFSKLFSFNH